MWAPQAPCGCACGLRRTLRIRFQDMPLGLIFVIHLHSLCAIGLSPLLKRTNPPLVPAAAPASACRLLCPHTPTAAPASVQTTCLPRAARSPGCCRLPDCCYTQVDVSARNRRKVCCKPHACQAAAGRPMTAVRSRRRSLVCREPHARQAATGRPITVPHVPADRISTRIVEGPLPSESFSPHVGAGCAHVS